MKQVLVSCLMLVVCSGFARADEWTCDQPDSGSSDKPNFSRFCQLDSGQQLRVRQSLLMVKTYYVDGHYSSCINELAALRKTIPDFQDSKQLDAHCKNGASLIARSAAINHQSDPFNGDFATAHDFWKIRTGDSLENFKANLMPTHRCKIESSPSDSSDFIYYACANAPYGAQRFSFFKGHLRKFSASVFKDVWNPTFRNSLAQIVKNAKSRPYEYQLDGPVAECDRAKCKTYVFKKGKTESSIVVTETDSLPVAYSQIDQATMDASIAALAKRKK